MEVMGETRCVEPASLFCAVHVAGDFGDVAGVFVGAVEARWLMHVEVLVWSQEPVKEGRVEVHVFHYEVVGGGERDRRAHRVSISNRAGDVFRIKMDVGFLPIATHFAVGFLFGWGSFFVCFDF